MTLYREANFNFIIETTIETTITLILFERKHNMARGISKRTLATLVIPCNESVLILEYLCTRRLVVSVGIDGSYSGMFP